jgi:hypothetical protein
VRIIEQIGSYAGLAAIPGLAVLSALYFSQARDVRRLREWAGRAPERAAEQAVGGRVQVLPGQAAELAQPAAAAPGVPAGTAAGAGAAGDAAGAKPGVGAAAGAGAAKPAVAAAAGTQPATAAGPSASGEPATPAGRAAAALGDAEKAASGDGADAPPEQAAAGANGAGAPAEAAPSGDADSARPAAKPGALTPAAVASAAAAAKAPARPGAAGTAARTGPPAVGGAARAATAPGATTPRRHIPSLPHSSRTSVLDKGARPGDPWYRNLAARLPAGRYLALIVAGALVLGGGAVFAISQLGGGSDNGSSSAAKQPSGTPANPGGSSASKKDQNVKSTPAVDPSKVTVTVVNGTTIPNLARDTAAKLSQAGFQIGNKVTGTGSLAAAESVVEYRPGAEAAARFVAAKLGITQKQPADPDAIAQAGPAQVIVVLGADQAPGG